MIGYAVLNSGCFVFTISGNESIESLLSSSYGNDFTSFRDKFASQSSSDA